MHLTESCLGGYRLSSTGAHVAELTLDSSSILWRMTVAGYVVGLVAQVVLAFASLPPVSAQTPAIAFVLFVVVATFGAATYRHPDSRSGRVPVVAILRSAAPWTIALGGVHVLWFAVRATPLAGRGGFRGDEPWPRDVWLVLPAMELVFITVTFAILSSIERRAAPSSSIGR